jgi:cytochrome c oxidase subunit 1
VLLSAVLLLILTEVLGLPFLHQIFIWLEVLHYQGGSPVLAFILVLGHPKVYIVV